MNISDINPVTSSRKMNNLMESRFGFTLDYNKLTYAKAQKLRDMVSENINRIRFNFGIHQAERNPKYMELLMVREGLTRWMNENQQLMEGEMGRSEAILAAKDMVDSIQDMVEKVSKMQVEQLPALIDTIRDQIGMQEAETFKTSMGDLLRNIAESLAQARETADTSARSLAGEEGGIGDMGGMGGMGGMQPPMGGDLGAPPLGEPSDLDTDEFGATDAAVGGTEPVGREKR
jgi:hypothetical protein